MRLIISLICAGTMFLFGQPLLAEDYNIRDYGALEGQLSTAAVQKAIDDCAANGGGRVVVPAGTYIIGTIELKSHVNLHLEQGAILLGSLNLEDYTRSIRNHGMIFRITPKYLRNCTNEEMENIGG